MNRIGLPLAMVAMLAVAACAPADPPHRSEVGSPDSGASLATLLEAHENWVTGFEDGDVDRLVRLLEPSGHLVLFHPGLEARYGGPDEARYGLRAMFDRLGDPACTEVHVVPRVEGSVGWLTSYLLVETPRETRPFRARVTEIWVYRDDGWRMAHAHWSEMPPDVAEVFSED